MVQIFKQASANEIEQIERHVRNVLSTSDA